MVSSSLKIKTVSPLDGMVLPSGNVSLTEKRLSGKLNIRGNAHDTAFTSAAEKVLGTSLPLEANTVHTSEAYTVFWLGPDEWMVHGTKDGAQDCQAALTGELKAAFGDLHVAINDVSDYYVMIEMRGAAARDVLTRACPLDLHARVFKPGQCAQSYFANAAILLHQVDEDAYDLQVRWTYAQYLWTYLSQTIEQIAD